MVPRVKTAGFRAIEIKQAYAQAERYPAGPLQNAACYLTSPAVAAEVQTVIAAEAPDLILIDAMFPAALAEAAQVDRPTAVICHTFWFRHIDAWRQQMTRIADLREQAGFSALPGADQLWQAHDRIVVTALGAFDHSPLAGWEMVRHAGPVLEDEKCAVPTALPWGDGDTTPLALISFSTGFEQRSLEKLQRSLDALAELPLHVVATTGGIVNPQELAAPANAVVLNYAAHDPILRRAALAVTHGGHGTAMRSLRHGVPMILMPGLAHDQAPIAAIMEEWGTGRALAGDAASATIRAAAQEILSTPSFRDNARRHAAALAGIDGAGNAADEVEALLEARSAAHNHRASRRIAAGAESMSRSR